MSSSSDPNHRQQQQQDLIYGKTNAGNSNNTNNNNNINTTNNLVSNSLQNTSSSSSNNNVNNTEQPQTKRQKIEKIKPCNGNSKAKNAPSCSSMAPPPDIIDTGETKNLSSSLSSSAHSITSPSSSDTSPSSTPSSSRAASLTQLLNVQNLNHILPIANGHHHHQHLIHQHLQHHHHHLHNHNHHEDDVMSSSSSHSTDEVDRSGLPDLLTLNNQNPIIASSSSKARHNLHMQQQQLQLEELTASQDMREFEESLNKQCLCGVSERMLRKPFQSHYSTDANGQKRVANLSEWPTNKLLQFLSNLQLLFDIYLKQNSKGFICARIMDVCDALIRNDHNLIDEIIVLASYSNAYVQFLAGRVLASFLVIAKQEMDDDWLKKLVDNLFNFDRLDHKAVQKIHFSLEIIKRIVEWKDIDLHPLEEEIADTQTIADTMPAASSSASSFHNSSANNLGLDETNLGYLHFQAQQPTLESNYFAVHYRSTESLDGPSSSGSSSGHYQHHNNYNNSGAYHQAHHQPTPHPSLLQQQGKFLIL